ncbi:MAG: hypothetical protein R2865_02490 [Deinococcales bacterium]
MAEISEMHPADIYIGSHTHQPMKRHFGHKLILNTGAVGTPFNRDPRAQYLILDLAEELRCDFRAVAYDQEAAIGCFEASEYLAKGDLSAFIFGLELKLSRGIYGRFWIWTEQLDYPRNWQTWQEFCQNYPEIFNESPTMADMIGKAPSFDLIL